jgi:hypothetical protein
LNGIIIELEFIMKGWFGLGSNHAFAARAYRAETPTSSIYTAKGTWKPENYTVYDGATGAVLDTVKLAERSVQLVTINTKSLTEQDPLESRRAWRPVAAAIKEGNLAKATAEKSKLEEAQRAARKKELEAGVPWHSKYFHSGDDKVAEELIARVGGKLREDETKGVWRWAKGSGA